VAHHYKVNADVLESAILDGLNELLIDKKLFQKAVFDGNPVGVVANELTEKRQRLIKEIGSLEKINSNLLSSIEYLGNDDFQNFIGQAKGKIAEVEKKLNDFKFQRDIVDNQLKTLPTSRQIENERDRMRAQLARRAKESYVNSGAALASLPFSEKKKIIQLFFGGLDNDGKKYGIYIRPLEGKPKRYQFKAYGKIGFVEGLLNKRCDKEQYYSFPRSNKNDDEALHKTAEILADANPGLKIKEHMLCHDRGNRPPD
jgi:hypothetical protein